MQKAKNVKSFCILQFLRILLASHRKRFTTFETQMFNIQYQNTSIFIESISLHIYFYAVA